MKRNPEENLHQKTDVALTSTLDQPFIDKIILIDVSGLNNNSISNFSMLKPVLAAAHTIAACIANDDSTAPNTLSFNSSKLNQE